MSGLTNFLNTFGSIEEEIGTQLPATLRTIYDQSSSIRRAATEIGLRAREDNENMLFVLILCHSKTVFFFLC